VVTLRPENWIFQLAFLCLGLLQANDIRIRLREPFEKTLSRRRSDAVAIKCDDSHDLILSLHRC